MKTKKAERRTRTTAFRINYRGLSKHPLGGWDYSRTRLGTIDHIGSETLEELERNARMKWPESNALEVVEVVADREELISYCTF